MTDSSSMGVAGPVGSVVRGMCQGLGMLEIVVETESWQRHVRVSAEELAGRPRRLCGTVGRRT